MKFGKETLDKIEHISLALENCERFDIAAEDVLDLWTSEIVTGENKIGRADDGGLVISKTAFQNLSSFADAPPADAASLEDEPKEIYYLYDRVINCCDICRIDVKFKCGDVLSFYVPYDPLECHSTGGEISLSNCPSAELDENGDMLVLFGESSHAYKRTDDNYSELIIGLTDAIKKPLDERLREEKLQLEIREFSNNEWSCRCPRLFVETTLKNKGCAGKRLEFVFEDVRQVYYDIGFHNKRRRLWMSRLSEDEIYVEIEDFCSFRCSAAKTYEAYVGRDIQSDERLRGDVCEKAVACELSESEMELFALDDGANCKREFCLAEFVAAMDKALRGEISAKYFKNWLQAYTAMVQRYMDSRLEDACYPPLIALDRLQIKLSYSDDLSACRQTIQAAAQEIEKFCLKNSSKSSS